METSLGKTVKVNDKSEAGSFSVTPNLATEAIT